MTLPPKHILSKSTFIRGLQCEKSLYLYKNYYHLRDKPSEELQMIFDRGTKIGEMAQQLFPGGIDVSPSHPFKYQESVALTQKMIQEGKQIIYEACFQYEGVLVALDILVKKADGWYGYEVKSSTKISETYLLDASIQYFVIQHAGIDLKDFSIIYVNNEYVKNGKIDLSKYFSISSVTEHTQAQMKDIAAQVDRLKIAALRNDMPEVNIGAHCFAPYPCDYMSYCWKNFEFKNSVFEINGMNKARQMELLEKGFVLFEDVSLDEQLTAHQRIQVENKTIIDKESIKDFLDKINYPVCFLDFESFQPAVPLFDGTKPYEQIAFQYSIHYQNQKKEGKLKHNYFLAHPGTDFREEFLKKLLADLSGIGSILVYNASFEKMILNSLARQFPAHKSAIAMIIERIIDLMEPFQKKHLYLPEMKGSHSIKYVLPSFDKTIQYKDLAIQNGLMATMQFNQLFLETDMFKMEEIRNNLLEYCKLDTLAMVKILEGLYKIID
jgi:hypothetical protein